MSYTQTFTGEFRYANAHYLEASLDAFVADLDEVIVDFDDLKIADLSVRLDYHCSAPASMYDPTLSALSRLGELAISGRIEATFHLDGVSREHVSSGGHLPKDLPPRHHKWELVSAAKRGDVVALRELRELGVAFDQDLLGRTALHLAAAAGSPEAVAFVLAAGVPVDNGKVTPLAVAANAPTATVLLDAGAKLDVTVHGESLFTATCGRADIAALLLDRGAAIPPAEYQEIAQTLARTAQIELLRRVLERDPAFAVALRDDGVMACAIRSNEPVLVDFLVDQGATPPEKLFETAIEEGATAIVENALAAPDAIARCGNSSTDEDAMCIAASHCQVAVMELLAKHGVPIHPATPGETSPIHRAAGSYDRNALACVTWLLDHGVPVTATTADGRSVLQAAAFVAVKALVVSRGGDASEIDWNDLAVEDAEELRKLLPRATKAKKSAAKKSATKKPTTKKPTAKKPTAKKPTTKKPTTKKPTTKKPTTKKPAAKKSKTPATTKPAAKQKPVAKRPAAKKSATKKARRK